PIPLIDNVAAVLRDRRTDAGLDQLFDLVDDLRISRIFVEIFSRDLDVGCGAVGEQWSASDEVVQQGFENEWFEVRPGYPWRGRHGDEIAAIEHALHHAAVEQRLCKR